MPIESVPGLKDLAERLEDISPLPAPHELARWIVASQHNMDLAEEMYRKSADWRMQKSVDRIISWKPPGILRKYYPGGFAGFDGEGCPVWIIPFGHADVKGMLACVSKEEFMDFTLKIVECSMMLMRKNSLISGKPVSQHVFIFDLDGFSLKSATHRPMLDILQKVIAVYEANYPETLKAAFVLNTSSFFQTVFKIIQSTVQQNTLRKINVFGVEGWKSALDAACPVDILPPQWGGTNTGADICLGGEVSGLELSQHKPQQIPGMGGDIHDVRIEPGSFITLRYTVNYNGLIRWKFKSEGGDLGFGVQRRKALGGRGGEGFEEDHTAVAEDVVVSERLPSHKEIQFGALRIVAGFTYLLNFDNKFSRFKTKNIMYGVVLEESDYFDLDLNGSTLSVEDIVHLARNSREEILENK